MSREDEVLKFLVDYKKAHNGNSPSMREIGEGCGMSSVSVVGYYLTKLIASGHIEMEGVKAISVRDGFWKLASPVVEEERGNM